MKRCVALASCVVAMMVVSGTAVLAETDPLVEEMVGAVSKDRVTGYVQTLQDFQTRHTYTQGNTDAGNWLFDYFTSLGLEVERHEFTYGTHTEENIIARIPGTTYPEEIVAISGHFDSTSNDPYVLAPGADDDASGIAAVLEAAWILRDYAFDRTVEFYCFNAEEQGRMGSNAIASDYLDAGKDLRAVLNSDMIGYWPTGWQRDLDVAYEPVSEWLADHVVSACQRYVGIPAEKHPSASCRDDHYAFTLLGFSAVTSMDCWEAHNGGGETTPHYHRTTDTVETLNLDCMTQVVQVQIASLAELAGPRAPGGIGELGPLAAAQLLGSHPNPFGLTTEIRYVAPPGAGRIVLEILDVQGRKVRRLVDGAVPPGARSAVWNGRDTAGRPVSSGVYFYRLRSGATMETRRLALVR